jgi:hypothetical protein
MTGKPPRVRTLQPHESGCMCPLLLEAMKPGQEIAECSACGVLHDHAAWQALGGCSTAGCAAQPNNRSIDPSSVIQVSDRDIWGPRPTTTRPEVRPVPPPSAPPPPSSVHRGVPESQSRPRGQARVIVEFEIQTASFPKVVRLRKLPCSIGSADSNDIRLRHPSVRSHHARISRIGGSLYLQQTGGGRPPAGATGIVGQPLSNGGRFKIGDVVVTVRFRRVAPQPPPPPSAPALRPYPARASSPSPPAPPAPAAPPSPPSPPTPPSTRAPAAPPAPPPPPPALRAPPTALPPRHRLAAPPPPALTPIHVPAFPPMPPTVSRPPAQPEARSSVQPIRRTVEHGDAVRTCPYSMETLVPGTRVAECPKCGQVLIEAAWEENRGCTTYGCDGAPDFRKDRL